jgi:hypothetical protein
MRLFERIGAFAVEELGYGDLVAGSVRGSVRTRINQPEHSIGTVAVEELLLKFPGLSRPCTSLAQFSRSLRAGLSRAPRTWRR